MKRVLITGAGSYIGTSFEKYIKENYPDEYIIDTVDMLDEKWRDKDFSGYDSVFHVAGIAHRKETNENVGLYYTVNCDLAVEVAKKAKKDNVKQFVFLSSMSVYGMDTGVITKETSPIPKSNYGKSKLMAEEGITALATGEFKVCVLRPPMVYGKDCKGNFQSIVKIVKKSPVFPRVKNKRSMIYIDNLSSFVKYCIDNELQGLYFPQNKEYVETQLIADCVAKAFKKKLYFSFFMGCGVALFLPFARILQKAFGSLVYEGTEDFEFSYCVCEKCESIMESV